MYRFLLHQTRYPIEGYTMRARRKDSTGGQNPRRGHSSRKHTASMDHAGFSRAALQWGNCCVGLEVQMHIRRHRSRTMYLIPVSIYHTSLRGRWRAQIRLQRVYYSVGRDNQTLRVPDHRARCCCKTGVGCGAFVLVNDDSTCSLIHADEPSAATDFAC